MLFLISGAKAFVSALAGVLAAALFAGFLLSQKFQPWIVLSVTAGIAITAAAHSQWALSRAIGAMASGMSVGIFFALGQWLSLRYSLFVQA